MQTMIEVPQGICETIESGKRLSLHEQREVIELVKSAVLSTLPPVRYEDDGLRIVLPNEGIVIGGKCKTLSPANEYILHRLMCKLGDWVLTGDLCMYGGSTSYDFNMVYVGISRLRAILGAGYIESDRRGRYRFAGNESVTVMA